MWQRVWGRPSAFSSLGSLRRSPLGAFGTRNCAAMCSKTHRLTMAPRHDERSVLNASAWSLRLCGNGIRVDNVAVARCDEIFKTRAKLLTEPSLQLLMWRCVPASPAGGVTIWISMQRCSAAGRSFTFSR